MPYTTDMIDFDFYTKILKKELVPAMGCTEPIAIAYATAKAKSLVAEDATHVVINCSGNIIKNVKAVTVPHSGGQKGIEMAATLGVISGDASKMLEVIADATDDDRARAIEKVKEKFCDVNLVEGVSNLYIDAIVETDHHKARAVLEGSHTNITLLQLDEKILFEKKCETQTNDVSFDLNKMKLNDILTYANEVPLDDVRQLLENQIEKNTKIAQEGLDNAWGACIGKTILEEWGSDVKSCAIAKAAAGSDARMSGCPLPVVINSGSGNQGITVTLPVTEYANAWKVSDEKKLRALIVSNLVSIYIKHYIGPLSAFCGAVSAASGAGAAITFMSGGDYAHIARTITNTLANVGGIVCDGAKPSCAAKIASSVHAAILAHCMSESDKQFNAGEGLVESDVEETIKNIGYIGKVGMKETDTEILNVMIDKVDVDSCL